MDAILTAATRVLAKEGLEKLDTNRIAKDAGVSIGSLYQYFPDKRALLASLLARERRRALEALERALDAHAKEPVEIALRAGLAAVFEIGRANAGIHQALFHDAAALIGDPDGGRTARVEVEKSLARFLDARRDELPPIDSARAAFTMVQSVNGLTHEAMVRERSAVDAARLLDEATRLCVGYLRGS